MSTESLRHLVLCLSILALPFLVACDADEVQGPISVCEPVPSTIEPATGPAAGGTEATATGLWLTADDPDDIVVRVGAVDAAVLTMARVGCDPCDACATESLRCATCDRECRGLDDYTDNSGQVHDAAACTETLVFVTPPGAPGPSAVSIINARGQSDALTFTYESGDDDDSAGDDDDAAGDDDDSAGDDDDSAGDDDDSAGDDDDSAGDDDDSARE